MNAKLEPIAAKVIERPSYVHPEWLGVDQDAWIAVNLVAIRARWDEMNSWDGISDEDDFPTYCLVQYDMEMSRKEELKREWATLPRERRE